MSKKLRKARKELSKWHLFSRQDSFAIVDLGRPAVFLIPAHKLYLNVMKGVTTEQHLESFLKRNFKAFTRSQLPVRGFWEGVTDELIEYEVSFLGKHNIPLLLWELAHVARKIHEKYIYVRLGQYAGLVRPKRRKNKFKRTL